MMKDVNGKNNLNKNITEIWAGTRRIYLPANNCVFEFETESGLKILFWATKIEAPIKTASGFAECFSKESFIARFIGFDPKKQMCSLTPSVIIYDIDQGQLKEAQFRVDRYLDITSRQEALSFMDNDIQSGTYDGLIGCILYALSIYNSPIHQPEHVGTPVKLQKSRTEKIKKDSTEFPFFDYHVLKVQQSSQEENLANRKAAAQAAINPTGDSGIRQRFHQRNGYLRITRHTDGSESVTAVDSYWAGDATLGIISKTMEPALKT